MDLERAFAFIWEDEDGIGGLAVIGWVAELSRRVAHEEKDTLPEWDPIGDYFLNGLKYIAISFIWGLPISLPIIMISALGAGGSMVLDDPSPFIAFISIFSVCFTGIAFIYILGMNLLLPTLMVPLAEGTTFADLLNPSHAWKTFRANGGSFLVALLISWLAGSVLSFVGTLLCFIGALPAFVIGQLFMGHLIGQATSQARENLEATPAVPVE